MSEILRVSGYDAATAEWQAHTLWQSNHRGLVEADRAPPPLAAGRAADGSVVAVPAGRPPGEGRVAVDPADPSTVVPPGVGGLPSPAVTGEWNRRRAVPVPAPEVPFMEEDAPGSDASHLVGCPDGRPVAGVRDEGGS